MLVLSFFATVFISILWLVFAGFYISARFAGTDFYALGLNDAALCAVLLLLPLFVLWMIWGRFCGLRHETALQKQFLLLSSQIRQSQEYSDIIARLLLKESQLQAHAYAMGKIDLYIGEMNEILSDILRRYRLLNEDEMREVWTTVRLGNRWGFAKAFVDLHNAENGFEDKLLAAAGEQTLLAGSLTEFCARYTRLLGLLKKHDEENILQDIIETGAFGRVFAIFAPIVRRLYEKGPETEEVPASEAVSDEIVLSEDERFFKDEYADEEQERNDEPGLFDDMEPEEEEKADDRDIEPKPTVKSFWSRLLGLHDEEDDTPKRPDPLTIALERSFGTPEEPRSEEKTQADEEKTEPSVTAENQQKDELIPPAETASAPESEPAEQAPLPDETVSAADENNAPAPAEPEKHFVSKRFAFANTDKTIKNLQKEWEEMKKNDKAAGNVKTTAE